MARDVMTIRLQLRLDPCGGRVGGHDQPPCGRGRVDLVGVDVVGGAGSRPGWCMMCDLGGFATEGSGIGR